MNWAIAIVGLGFPVRELFGKLGNVYGIGGYQLSNNGSMVQKCRETDI
jgi:hypothetical protein